MRGAAGFCRARGERHSSNDRVQYSAIPTICKENAAKDFDKGRAAAIPGQGPAIFTHLESPRGSLPQPAGEGGEKRRMGCGPLLRPKSACTNVTANLRSQRPAFHTPPSPSATPPGLRPGQALPRFAEKWQAYPNLKSAETRLDILTWASVIESVASSLIVTSDPACDIAPLSAA